MLGKNSNMGKRGKMCHASNKNVEASTEMHNCGKKCSTCKRGNSVKSCK